jgi:hypothetical protein
MSQCLGGIHQTGLLLLEPIQTDFLGRTSVLKEDQMEFRSLLDRKYLHQKQ